MAVDSPATQEAAVSTAEVFVPDLRFIDDDSGMPPAHADVSQHQVIVFGPTEMGDASCEKKSLLWVPSTTNHQFHLSVRHL